MNFIILFLVLILAFICGDNVLGTLGYPHDDIAAASIFRLHPLTYLSFALLIFYFLIGKIKVSDLVNKMKNESLFLTACIIVIIYLQLINSLNAISFFFDALVLPAILLILLKATSKKVIGKFSSLIYIFFFINALVAVIEKTTTTNLIVQNPIWHFEYFRSSAIFGHPLNNGLIMAVLTIILFWATKNSWLKVFVLLSGVLSIFCFGARGALIGVFLGIMLNMLLNAIGLSNEKSNKKMFGGLLYLCIFGAIISVVVMYTGLGDRIAALSHVDNSAEARVDSFNMFNGQDTSDLLWGGYSVHKIEMMQHMQGVEIIENFYVVWILKFGLVMTVLLFGSLVKFLFDMMKNVGLDIKLPILVTLFFVASTNNSLASNSLVLSIVILSYYILYESKKQTTLSMLFHRL